MTLDVSSAVVEVLKIYKFSSRPSIKYLEKKSTEKMNSLCVAICWPKVWVWTEWEHEVEDGWMGQHTGHDDTYSLTKMKRFQCIESLLSLLSHIQRDFSYFFEGFRGWLEYIWRYHNSPVMEKDKQNYYIVTNYLIQRIFTKRMGKGLWE